MADSVDELLSLLSPVLVQGLRYQAQSEDLRRRAGLALFGGQLLGQAIYVAADATGDDRLIHSLHARFLRPGTLDRVIDFDVTKVRDGKAFSVRQVVAAQSGKEIFSLSASFHTPESGFSHRDVMPQVAPPESLLTQVPQTQGVAVPFDLRPVPDVEGHAQRFLWFRTRDALSSDNHAVHVALFAYVSEYYFASTALLPHAVTLQTPGLQVITLEHTTWIHCPFRVDDWLLHAIESPVAEGGRALIRGRVFDRNQRLVASVVQEVLIRFATRSKG